MSVLLPEPGAAIPGALVPGFASPGIPGDEVGGYVTLDTEQILSGVKTFIGPGDNNSGSTGHWLGSVVTDDITIQPNSNISASASMFLDNNAGQVYEFYCDNTGEFGVFDKTANSQTMLINDGAHGHGVTFYGNLETPNNTLDDGAGRLTTTNDVHVGEWLYVAGNVLASGGCSASLTTVTSNYTAGLTDSTVLSNGASTITLPTASGVAGRVYTVKNIHAGSVTLATTSSQTIDGAASYALSAQYKYVTVQSDGSNWFVIANN